MLPQGVLWFSCLQWARTGPFGAAQRAAAVDEGGLDGSQRHLWGVRQELEETFCPEEESAEVEPEEEEPSEELDEELEEESEVDEESEPLLLVPEEESAVAGAEPLELLRESVR